MRIVPCCDRCVQDDLVPVFTDQIWITSKSRPEQIVLSWDVVHVAKENYLLLFQGNLYSLFLLTC